MCGVRGLRFKKRSISLAATTLRIIRSRTTHLYDRSTTLWAIPEFTTSSHPLLVCSVYLGQSSRRQEPNLLQLIWILVFWRYLQLRRPWFSVNQNCLGNLHWSTGQRTWHDSTTGHRIRWRSLLAFDRRWDSYSWIFYNAKKVGKKRSYPFSVPMDMSTIFLVTCSHPRLLA
jgi:hypothetical protein